MQPRLMIPVWLILIFAVGFGFGFVRFFRRRPTAGLAIITLSLMLPVPLAILSYARLQVNSPPVPVRVDATSPYYGATGGDARGSPNVAPPFVSPPWVEPPFATPPFAVPPSPPAPTIAVKSSSSSRAAKPKVPLRGKKPSLSDEPPPPPMAVALNETVPTSKEIPALPHIDSPIVLFSGTSTQGRPLAALPDWAADPSKAVSGEVILTSEPFATPGEADLQLWQKAETLAADNLHKLYPASSNYRPTTAVLKRAGLVVDRCIERTELKVGSFTEPMYRVYWRTRPDAVREAVTQSWRPNVVKDRVVGAAQAAAGVTGILVVMNLLLRGVASRLARKEPTA